MNLKKVILILLIVGLGVGLYVYFFVLNKSHPDFAGLEADFQIPAEQLYQEFVADPTAASAKFNGKMIQLSGQINSMEAVDTLSIAVYVFNEGMFGDEGVRCTFLKAGLEGKTSVEDLAGYEIKGFCSGFNETDVILEKCSIVKK